MRDQTNRQLKVLSVAEPANRPGVPQSPHTRSDCTQAAPRPFQALNKQYPFLRTTHHPPQPRAKLPLTSDGLSQITEAKEVAPKDDLPCPPARNPGGGPPSPNASPAESRKPGDVSPPGLPHGPFQNTPPPPPPPPPGDGVRLAWTAAQPSWPLLSPVGVPQVFFRWRGEAGAPSSSSAAAAGGRLPPPCKQTPAPSALAGSSLLRG